MQKIPAKEVATDREVFGASDLDQSLKEIKGQKFMDFVNVKDFGAKGDGVTDDTQAFLDAVKELENKSVLYIPSGNYLITEKLILENNNIIIKGETKTKIIIDNTSITHLPIFAAENLENIIIENITFEGYTEHSYKGIEFTNCLNVEIKKCINKKNMNDSIIEFTNSKNIFIKNNYITGSEWNSGIAVYGNSKNIFISDNYITGGNAYYPIDIEPAVNGGTNANNVHIFNNIIENSVWDGIAIQKTFNAFCYNNYIDGISDSSASGDGRISGIKIVEGHNINIYKNKIKNCDNYGINLIQTYNVKIEGNETFGNANGSLFLNHNVGKIHDIFINKNNLFNENNIVYSNLEKIYNIYNDLENIKYNLIPSNELIGYGSTDTFNPLFTLTGNVNLSKDKNNTKYSNYSLKADTIETWSYLTYVLNENKLNKIKNKIISLNIVYKGDSNNDLNPLIKISDGVNTKYYGLDDTITNFTQENFLFKIDSSATQLIIDIYFSYGSGTTGTLWFDYFNIGTHQVNDEKSILYATSIPDNDKWNKGDKIYNANVSAGGYIGWICTSSGTPGTWKGFGSIES